MQQQALTRKDGTPRTSTLQANVDGKTVDTLCYVIEDSDTQQVLRNIETGALITMKRAITGRPEIVASDIVGDDLRVTTSGLLTSSGSAFTGQQPTDLVMTFTTVVFNNLVNESFTWVDRAAALAGHAAIVAELG